MLLDKNTILEKMCIMRELDEFLLKLYSENKIGGTIHTSLGQEAIAIGLASNLCDNDYVFASHRCHAHFIAYGGDLGALAGEILGKEAGLCKGMGGSQHINYNHFYSNGVQGGIVANAVGVALSKKMNNQDGIVVVFLGDGTLGEGLVYESFNFASLNDLPILFVVENNQYAQSTPIKLGVAGEIIDRAYAFGIGATRIESNDALELCDIFNKDIENIKNCKKPFLQEIVTYRLGPHSKGDDNRDKAEIDSWKLKDPLEVIKKYFNTDDYKRIQNKSKLYVESVIEGVLREKDAKDCVIENEYYENGNEEVIFPSEKITVLKSLNQGLSEALNNSDVFLIGEDLSDPYGGAFKISSGLSTKFGARVISTPISEAGIIGWSIGAALNGHRPVAEIMFGDFATLIMDQIINHASKYKSMYGKDISLPVTIRIPMGGRRGYGPTHSQSLERLFFGCPNIRVACFSNLLNIGDYLKNIILKSDITTIFIENKSLYSKFLLPQDNLRINDFYIKNTNGMFPTIYLSLDKFNRAAATIICYGDMVEMAMEASKLLLLNNDMLVDIVVPSILSPLPKKDIVEGINSKNIFILEDGFRPFGWGSEVIASLSELNKKAHYNRITTKYCVIPAAREAENDVFPSTINIVNEILRNAV